MTDEELAKRKDLLLLAAVDMEQVIEAAKAIQRAHEESSENVQLVRALETAVAVCYWRPFSKSNRIGHLTDADVLEPTLHAHLKTFRDQVYAHIDKTSGRTADVGEHVTPTGVRGLAFTEGWWPLPAEWLPWIIDVATRQRDSYRAEAVEVMQRLASFAQ